MSEREDGCRLRVPVRWSKSNLQVLGRSEEARADVDWPDAILETLPFRAAATIYTRKAAHQSRCLGRETVTFLIFDVSSSTVVYGSSI